MDKLITDYADQNGFDANAVRNLIDFMVGHYGKHITEDTVEDLVSIGVPEFMRMQENLAVQALTHMSQFAPLIADLIRAERN